MSTPIIDNEKVRDEAVKVACMYLLYEKENETALRTAFVALAQERHDYFHSKKKREDNEDPIDFPDCKNEICQAAARILRESRDPSVEFTPLSLQLIDGYVMKIERTQNSCRVYLTKKDKVEPAILKPESIKLTI